MSSKITMIKGDSTPAVFCANLAEIADDVENIACVVQFKTGTAEVFSTVMNNGERAWLRWVFDSEFQPEAIRD